MAGPWSVTGRNRRSFHWITSLVIPSAFRRSRALGLNPRTGTAREQPRAAVTSLCFAAGGWKEVVGQLPLTPAWPEVGGKDAGRLIRIAWIGHTCARLIVLRAGGGPLVPQGSVVAGARRGFSGEHFREAGATFLRDAGAEDPDARAHAASHRTAGTSARPALVRRSSMIPWVDFPATSSRVMSSHPP